MRAAYVCADPGIPVFGTKGASVHVREMLRALSSRAERIDLFAARAAGEMPVDLRDKVRLHEVPIARVSSTSDREAGAIVLAEEIARALEHIPEIDFLYERYSLWSADCLEFANERGIPSALEVNAPLIEEQTRHREIVRTESAYAIARRAFSSAGTIAAVSREVAHWVTDVEPAAAGGRVEVVANGVNPARFRGVAPAFPRDPSTFVVGFVGTLKPWHGLECLVDAFRLMKTSVPQARLLIVGDGPMRGDIESRLAIAGLSESSVFTGAVDPDTVPAWLAAMDAAVAPYPALQDFYFSPLKIYEYLAAGVPTVASRIGQVEEVLRDGETALLTEPGDPEELANALARLATDSNLLRQLGEAGRYESELHTWEAIGARILRNAGMGAPV